MTLLAAGGALLTHPIPVDFDPPAEYDSNAFQLPVGNATELAAGIAPSEGKQHGRSLNRACYVDANGDIQGNPDRLDLCVDIGQILTSDDNGITWARLLATGLHAYPMHSAVRDPHNQARIVALTGRNNTSPGTVANFPGIYLSTDAGATFAPVLTKGNVTGLGYPGVAFDSRADIDPLHSGDNTSIEGQRLIVPDVSTAGPQGCSRWYAVIDAGSTANDATTGKGHVWVSNNYGATWSILADVSTLGDVHKAQLTRDGALLWLASSRLGLCRYTVATGTLDTNIPGWTTADSKRRNCVWFELDVDDEDDIWVGWYAILDWRNPSAQAVDATGVYHKEAGSPTWTQVMSCGDSGHWTEYLNADDDNTNLLVAGPFVGCEPGGLGSRTVWVVGDAVANGVQNRVSGDNGATWDPWADVRGSQSGGARPGYTTGHQVQPRSVFSLLAPDPRVDAHAFGYMNANFWRTDGGDPADWRYSDTGHSGNNSNRSTHGVVEDASTPDRIFVATTDTGLFVSVNAWRSFAEIPPPPSAQLIGGRQDAKAVWVRPDGTGQRIVCAWGGAGARLFTTATAGADGWQRPNGTYYFNTGGSEYMGFIDAIGATPATMTVYCGRWRSTNGGVSFSVSILAADAQAEFLFVCDDGVTFRWSPANGTRDLWRGAWATPTKLTGWTHSLRPGGTSGLAVGNICFGGVKSDSTRVWLPTSSGDVARVRINAGDGSTTWEPTGLRAAVGAAGVPAAFPFNPRSIVVDPDDPNVVTVVLLEPGVPPLWRTVNGETAVVGDVVWENVSDDFPRVGRAELGVLPSRRDVLFFSQAGTWLLPPVAAGAEPSLSTLPAAYQFNDPAFAL